MRELRPGMSDAANDETAGTSDCGVDVRRA